jgi:hypothetical protein
MLGVLIVNGDYFDGHKVIIGSQLANIDSLFRLDLGGTRLFANAGLDSRLPSNADPMALVNLP